MPTNETTESQTRPDAQEKPAAALSVKGFTVRFATTRQVSGETVTMGIDTTVTVLPGAKQIDVLKQTQAANVRRVNQLFDEYIAELKIAADEENDPFAGNSGDGPTPHTTRPVAAPRPAAPSTPSASLRGSQSMARN